MWAVCSHGMSTKTKYLNGNKKENEKHLQYFSVDMNTGKIVISNLYLYLLGFDGG